MAQPAAQELELIEVRPIAAQLTPQAESAAEAWVAARRSACARVSMGEVFTAGDLEFGVVACGPSAGGGTVSEQTELSVGSLSVPVLKRVQLTYLDATAAFDSEVDGGDTNKLYKDIIRPFLERMREERRREGGHFLAVLAQDQVLSKGEFDGHDFGVRALDPNGRWGAVEERTEVYVSIVETHALEKVHILPYADTVPAAYTYDLFRDFLQPFFQAHPFALHGEGDHFTYRGVRFRVMATDPSRVAARVCNQTMVYTSGDPLQQTIWDIMPRELREELQRLPQGLQMLLLSTMANEEAMQGRLSEVQEVLRRGQGLAKSEISSCGQEVKWDAAEHEGGTQQQCMVCLTDFCHGDPLRKLPCEHLFHRECIDEWLLRSAACPICKRPAGANSSGGASSSSGAGGGAGLLHNARVACNGGHCGTVVGFDASCQRFRVVLEGSSREELVAVDDLVQFLSGVRLIGLRSAEFNGKLVQIVGIEATRGRYKVRVDGGRVLSVRTENCILPEGAVARVIGLRADGAGAHWNGRFGRVISFDQSRMRHLLQMQGGRGQLLSVRPKNLRV